MKFIKKNLPFVIFGILAIVGSFIGFYGTNLVMSDVSNMFYGARDFYFIASIPGFCLFILFGLGTIYLMRFYLRPEYRRSLTKLYLILLDVFSVISIVAAIVAGTVVYHDMLKPYPFPGYFVVSIVLYTLLIAFSIYAFVVLIKKLPEDTAKRKISIKYLGYLLVVLFAYNRFGAFLWSPTFIHWRTFYMTWPYYIWLLLPMVLLINIADNVFNLHGKGSKKGITRYAITLGLDIVFTVVVTVIGINNTQFISAVSPTVAIERLATKPIDTIVQFVMLFAFDLYFLIQEIHIAKKAK